MFGGFGSGSNTGQGTGFGGFGGSSNTGAGFGTSGSTGFGGGNTPGGGLFGNTSSGFGSGGGGFGTNTNTNTSTNLFGAKPTGFGTTTTTTGSTIFGTNTSTAPASNAFSGFGSTTTNATPAFGSGTTGGNIFGGNKPAFGATTTGTTGTNIFGGGTNNAFGTNTNTTSGFPASTALGGTPEQCPGTGGTPFQAFSEKEPGAGVTNHYQSISFQQPYQRWSFEELRLADYMQGRRFGNSNNQAGAFGANTGFGGFGTTGTGTGLFGNTATNTTTTPFGGTGTAGTFGATNQSGGGLFGQKPTGGLFGTSTSTSQPSGGLFGTSNTGTGFGSNSTSGGFGTTSTGGGLFGAANQSQNQPKPFSFSNATAGTGTGFGTAGGTGAFGNTQANTGGLFGGATQTNSPFGGNQQPATTNPFGGFGTQNQSTQGQNAGAFGGFGSATTPNKPLFGTATGANTGAGLFGSTTNQPQTGTGLFGGASNTQTSNLFAGSQQNQPKPGLFGASNAQPSTGSSIFGSGQTQPNQGGGLFGAPQQNQTKTGGLFGALGGTNTQQPSGGSLFGSLGGGTNTSNTGSSIFGGANNQNQQQGSGIFGASQVNQQQVQQSQPLTASINDALAYGPNDLFRGFGTPNAQSVGPLATPLSSSQKLKKNAILPQYKINPSASSRLVTPQRQGYGFSYSRYGTPSSISSSTSTPVGLSSSLLGGSIGRSLGKSLSTSNLRRSFESDDSVLAPGAFSASGNGRSGAGSLKKLVINRSIRGDLFASPENISALPGTEKDGQSDRQRSILKKRVSFEAGTAGGTSNGNIFEVSANGDHPLKQAENSRATPSAEEMGFMRSSARGKDKTSNATANGSSHLEMEQVKGNELAIVHEDGTPTPSTGGSRITNGMTSREDPVAGDYWTRPSIDELKSMPREKLKRVTGFTVGREGCGLVVFDVPADLTKVDLDQICGTIVVIILRSCTVYPDNSTKPPPGYGLNLPSTITLYNSWPRARDRVSPVYETSGPRYNKHIERLMRVGGTKFKSYDKDTGTWTFSVDHYTTYAVEYDDDDMTEDYTGSILSAPPDTPMPKSRTPISQDVSMLGTETSGVESSDPDDTFDFKKKSKKILPGGFGDEEFYADQGMADDQEYEEEDRSFLDERSVESTSEDIMDEPSGVHDVDTNPTEDDESVMVEDQDMAEPYPNHADTMELQGEVYSPLVRNKGKSGFLSGPKSILKPNVGHQNQNVVSPEMSLLAQNKGSAFSPFILSRQDAWTEQLQQTVSPKKQDRQALRESQGNVLRETERGGSATPKSKEMADLAGSGHGIATSIDLMNSLFGKDQGKKSPKNVSAGGKGKGFEIRPEVAPAHWPYAKKPKSYDLDDSSMHTMDRASHECFKPSWGPDGTFICTLPGNATPIAGKNSQHENGILVCRRGSFAYEGKDLTFAKFVFAGINLPKTLNHQLEKLTEIYVTPNGIPMARTSGDFAFESFYGLALPTIPRGPVEKNIWKLAAILWDDLDQSASHLTASTGSESEEVRAYIEDRLRKDNLSKLWRKLVSDASLRQIQATESREEAAIAYLSMNNVGEACGMLLDAGDFRLATLVSMIGGDRVMRKDIEEQLTAWRRLKALSEMMDSIRALYELLAGNTCLSEGMKGPLEDRAKTFVIPKRFGMDWRQTFGLYLWYAILEEQPLEDAVKLYRRDLEDHSGEMARPLPWFVEQGVSALWDDKHKNERVDLLWALLKLYADSKTVESEDRERISLEDILLPHNQELSPLDFRFSWQLQTLFAARGIGSLSPEKADQLTWDYAWQLEAVGEWPYALIILLHLSDPERVASAGRALISRHAAEFGSPEDDAYRLLVEKFQIPEVWIWEARALYARSVEHNHVAELDFLLKAKNWEEAHSTLCRFVAPTAVVEGNTGLLRRILGGFVEPDHVADWMLGGQVYLDYINLLRRKEEEDLHPTREPKSGTAGSAKPDQEPRKGLPSDNSTNAIVRRLMGALPQMLREERSEGFNLVKVAVQEMSAVVGRYVLKRMDTANHDAARVLQLPLTEDLCLKNTTEMSLRYYKALMLTSPSAASVRTRVR